VAPHTNNLEFGKFDREGFMSASSEIKFFSKPADLDIAIQENLYPQRVIYGVGALQSLVPVVKGLAENILIVTHAPGRFTGTGILNGVIAQLSSSSLQVNLFEISGTPDTETIDAGVKVIRDNDIELVVCIGGGKVLDAGKAMAILANNDGSCEDYQLKVKSISKPSIPVLAVPTTAGSGSEATTVAVIENKRLNIIRSLAHPFMMPQVALLDPIFMQTLPDSILATAGLDAFSHALESFTSPKATKLTKGSSLNAIRLVRDSLPKVLNDRADKESCMNLLLGSHIAGQALNAGVGAAHIFAQPLTAAIGVSHGMALSLVLEEVIKFNEKQVPDKYQEVLKNIEATIGSASSTMSGEIHRFIKEIGFDNKLQDFAMPDSVDLVMEKVVQTTSHIWTNACAVNLEDLKGILTRAWNLQSEESSLLK
jgi:alcohol dehydrogenase class IV